MTRRAKPQTTRLPVPAGELPAFTPVPRKCQRHDGWTPERQREFIAALADTGSVEAACKAVDMAQRGAYELRRQPGAKGFRAAWEAALQLGVQRIEDVVMDRALNGVEEPLYSYGKLVGTRRRYNDRLLMFILRNRAPERFAEGKPKGMNAVGKAEIERLRKEWRAEWESELRVVSAEDVRASIDRKVEAIRMRLQREAEHRWAALSEEAREAWAHFLSLRDRDLGAMNADAKTREVLDVTWHARSDRFDPPEQLRLVADNREDTQAEAPSHHPPEGWSYGKPKPPVPPRTEWTLKDEGFEP
ncbi:MAG: hypothetical protein ACK4IB_07890 [Erythrobacter sp.]